MFPEYREQIAHLRASNRHFSRLFDEHNALDQQIQNMVREHLPARDMDIEALKKQKLALKEALYSMLKKEGLQV